MTESHLARETAEQPTVAGLAEVIDNLTWAAPPDALRAAAHGEMEL